MNLIKIRFDEDVLALMKVLFGKREHGLLLISEQFHSRRPLVDGERILASVRGKIHAYRMCSSKENVEALERRFLEQGFKKDEKKWGCFDGAVRFYLPFSHPEDERLERHPLWVSKNIHLMRDPNNEIACGVNLALQQNGIYRRPIPRLPVVVESPDPVERLRAREASKLTGITSAEMAVYLCLKRFPGERVSMDELADLRDLGYNEDVKIGLLEARRCTTHLAQLGVIKTDNQYAVYTESLH